MEMIMNTAPTARRDDLVVSNVGDETLVYDQTTHQLHQLNTPSALVWRHCNGTASIAEIATSTDLSPELVGIALTRLEDAGLLLQTSAPAYRPVSQSRRTLLKKAGIVATLPAIVSVSAPMAAWASSARVQLTCGLAVPGCTNFVVCCSTYCTANNAIINTASLESCTDNGGGNYSAAGWCTCR